MSLRKQMSRKEFVTLVRYLEAHREKLLQERPRYLVVARMATAELGFGCTENNVRSAAVACDMKWSARRSCGRSSHGHVSRILARAIVELATAAGVKVDQDVQRIATGQRIGDPGPQDGGVTDA